MSRQMKKKEINKYRVEMWKLRKINSELRVWGNECCDRYLELLLKFEIRENMLKFEIRELKAENYSLKKRGLIDRIMNK